jgi:hypothetical protein
MPGIKRLTAVRKERHKSGYKPAHQKKRAQNSQRMREVFDCWGQNINIYDSLRATYLTTAIQLGRLTLFGE